VWKVKESVGPNDEAPLPIEKPASTHPPGAKGSVKNRSGGVVILSALGDDSADYDVNFGDDLNPVKEKTGSLGAQNPANPEPSSVVSNTEPPLQQQQQQQSSLSTSPAAPSNPPPITSSLPSDRRPNPVPPLSRPHNSPPTVEQVPVHSFIPPGQYPFPPVSAHVPSHLMYPFDQIDPMPGFYDQYLHPPTYGHHGLIPPDGTSHMGVSGMVPQSHLAVESSLNIRDTETPPAPGFNPAHENQEDPPSSVPPTSVNLQSMNAVASGIPLSNFGIGPAVLPGQPMTTQHQSMAHAHPYSQSGMYSFYPQPPYSGNQPPGPAISMPLPLHRYMGYPPKHGFTNQPQYAPNPPHYEDVEGFSHKPGVSGNFMMPMPFPQGPEQGFPRNRSGRITTNYKATVPNPTSTGQGQSSSIPPKPVHDQLPEGMLYTQPVRQTKHRGGYEEYHPPMESYYIPPGQQPPSYQSFHFGGPYPMHVHPRMPQYGTNNPTNSPLQRHDNTRSREGDGPSQ
jgi:hypothetical protein